MPVKKHPFHFIFRPKIRQYVPIASFQNSNSKLISEQNRRMKIPCCWLGHYMNKLYCKEKNMIKAENSDCNAEFFKHD